ncbi:hypothetical protein MCOR27_006718 [Pyricularia oryzae]|uniref:Stress-response A/B barrel domain-containing protein n=6 Tax=Pyricularia TaxID=48558 RepID=A0ABQ8NYC8_PYRGI|nr:uncharacterized protein MGG_02651 [Pyricularia oryzae 70-15]KAH8838169.1 hypothetical protein MCOR01_009616 [Pyricularia oryzae]KAI6303902.1 hypothetical protein MCOR33_001070 [Pyricularia grisea]EHA46391.1 hypothetical protein MGG_02651 [Pyricularia oryzae 70-15]KAH9437115.1 hypothetical protein MCOR02_000770 [Pyricularia oryzae]KAI6255918.1 hypothetical protein MCOR19_007600 [Pyricularia oryzae]
MPLNRTAPQFILKSLVSTLPRPSNFALKQVNLHLQSIKRLSSYPPSKMSGTRVHRVTMFKLPNPEDQQKLLAAYEQLAKTQSKDGKPYILSLCAGAAADDARAQGYTIVAKSEFASEEDMKYYDTECQAHGELKKTAHGLTLADKPLTVYFSGSPQLSV